jgi:endonuclease G
VAKTRRSAALQAKRNGRRRSEPIEEEAVLIAAANPAAAVETDPKRAHAISKGLAAGRDVLKKVARTKRDDPERMRARMSLVYPQDTHGYERILGERDIVQITFLHQALEAARSVCRLRVRAETPGPPAFGTGFLVAPGVLLTNHHVLDSANTAHLTLAEFDVELNLNYVLRQPRIFNLMPDKLFVTDAGLDFTFVAVNSVAHDGTPLTDFRWLRLLRQSGKGLNGEWATIIQHPGGQTKQIVLRENQIISLPKEYQRMVGPAFLHYRSDTEPGSSGSPVLNDQLAVVALHHKSVPLYNSQGQVVTSDGKTVWTPAMRESARSWIANEGVRISAIFAQLDQLALSSPHAAAALALLEDGVPRGVFSVLSGGRMPSTEAVEEGAELDAAARARRKGKGYKPDFLDIAVPLPKPGKALEKLVRPLDDNAQPKGSRPGELIYTHFSVVMHKERRMAIFAAVNVDGELRKPPTAKPQWRADARIAKSAQSLNDLYAGNQLDKGHLVRRLDPVWGEGQQEVDDAVIDTYHYTNAAPQEHTFNDGIWGDVEDYILGLAQEKKRRISVFTGPVFDDDDIEYRPNKPGGPWRIPARFWKVIVYVKPDGSPSATGFLLDQSDRIVDLDEKLTPLPEARKVATLHQKTVEEIEKLTDLDFGKLKTFDPLKSLEIMGGAKRIVIPSQIVV